MKLKCSEWKLHPAMDTVHLSLFRVQCCVSLQLGSTNSDGSAAASNSFSVFAASPRSWRVRSQPGAQLILLAGLFMVCVLADFCAVEDT